MNIGQLIMRVLASLMLLLYSLSALPPGAFAASFYPEQGTPLTEDQIKKIGGKLVGDKIFVGDLIYSKKELTTFGFRRNLWPNGVLVYQFEPSLTVMQRNAFITACQAWATVSPVSCVERTTEVDHVYVVNHTGNNCDNSPGVSCSFLGKLGGRQELAIYTTHWSVQSVIQHELGHAFGLVHEQSRPDRDTYVFIRAHNIKPKKEDNFAKDPSVVAYTDYDYLSIMHYGNCDFSIHPSCTTSTYQLQTIVPKPCNIDVVGGTAITTLDAAGMTRAYSPALYAMFVPSRSPSCGKLRLHPRQIKQLCGANCGPLSAITYNKVETRQDSWCGFVPNIDEKNYCRIIEKDYMTHWWDRDSFSCGRIGADTLHELWVQCGCAIQTVNAKCVHSTSAINMTAVERLSKSRNAKDRVYARFVAFVTNLRNANLVDAGVAGSLYPFLQRNYLKTKSHHRLNDMKCAMQIYLTLKRLRNNNYLLPAAQFKRIAKSYDLDVYGL